MRQAWLITALSGLAGFALVAPWWVWTLAVLDVLALVAACDRYAQVRRG